MELKIQSDRVLEAAKSCEEAKRVLFALFPEIFKGQEFNLFKLSVGSDGSVFDHEKARAAGFKDGNFMQVRTDGEFRGKAFYLDDFSLRWELKKDLAGFLCLIPTVIDGRK